MKNKNAAIDLLKFLFACMIVLFHASKNLGGVGDFFVNGRIAVEFFFLVSGYLMAASALRYSDALAAARAEGEGAPAVWKLSWKFLFHKIARIMPNFLLAWVIATVVTVVAKHYHGVTLIEKVSSGLFELLLVRNVGLLGFSPNGATWYLSVMFMSMALLFPFLLAKRDCFLRWFAPLAAVFLYGYLYVHWDNGLAAVIYWSGITTKGMYRALAGLCLGCSCYHAAEKLRALRPRHSLRLLATLVGLMSFLAVTVYVYFKKNSSFDYVLVLFLALGVTEVFSGLGYSAYLSASPFIVRIAGFLGEFSLNLFLSHGYWSNYLPAFLPDLKGKRLLAAYLAVSFCNALLLMLVSGLLRKAWPSMSKALRRAFLRE